MTALRRLRGGERRKRELAWALARHTTMPQSWSAARLGRGSASHVSHQAARHEAALQEAGRAGKPPSWMP